MATPDHFLPSERRALYLLIGIILLGGFLIYFHLDPAGLADRLFGGGSQALSSSEDAQSTPKGPVVVSVVGAVARPGTFNLQGGSCVSDAIIAAGGFLPTADPMPLDLSRKLLTSESLNVPERAPGLKMESEAKFRLSYYGVNRLSKKSGSKDVLRGKININTADVSELEKLPYIGGVAAGRIVEYRSQKGPFRSIEELDNVKGIGKVTIERIRPFLVDPAAGGNSK